MPDPMPEIYAKNIIRTLDDISDVCDREQAAKIYRQIVRLAQKIAQKHRFERKVEGVK